MLREDKIRQEGGPDLERQLKVEQIRSARLRNDIMEHQLMPSFPEQAQRQIQAPEQGGITSGRIAGTPDLKVSGFPGQGYISGVKGFKVEKSTDERLYEAEQLDDIQQRFPREVAEQQIEENEKSRELARELGGLNRRLKPGELSVNTGVPNQ